MANFRAERLAEQIHQVLSGLLISGAKDPALALVTVTSVDVTRDLQLARVYYTVTGDDSDKKAAATGLKRASAFLRHALGEEIQVRLVPELRFNYDSSIEQGRKIEDLLRQARKMESDDQQDS